MHHRLLGTFALAATAMMAISSLLSAAGGTKPTAIKGENQTIGIKDWNDHNTILNAVTR